MLLELGLENFILIERVVLTLASGLTVLTGETGAGKSLLVRALQLILGDRATTDVIRSGADEARIEALFEPTTELQAQLEGRGIPSDEGLIIRRVLPRSGRGRIYVNGSLSSLQDLRELTGSLVSLAGQHAFQQLIQRESHILWLDRYGGLGTRVAEVKTAYQAASGLRKALEEARFRRAGRREKEELLQFQAREIDQIGPQSGEEEALAQERQVLRAAATLRTLGEGCFGALYAEKGAVQEVLARCRQDLERMARLDPRLEKTLAELDAASYRVEEVALSLRDYVQALPTEMGRLEQIEERLHALRQLLKKYGPGVADVLAYRKEIQGRLDALADGAGAESRLSEDLSQVEERLLAEAKALSAARQQVAADLSRAVEVELSDLRLAQTTFQVAVETPEAPGPGDVGFNGIDRVQFLFSPNVGEAQRPLTAIASGGELSRVMLALRAVLAKRGGVETVAFDEIDAGIGGEVAGQVGAKLKALAARGQVIAVTHFPQIAAMADHHLVVEKVVEEGRTVTRVRATEGKRRLNELARMLGGDEAAARGYAGELLKGRGRVGV